MPVNPKDFVHLHVHSEYSLLDGANRLKPMVNYVKELGMESIAVTDHGVMFGVHEFHEVAKKADVKPILGCEVYITSGDRHVKKAGEQKKTHHLVLLAENYQGYKNLMKLSSLGHTEGYYYKPRIDFELLDQYKEGLIATSACLGGLIPQALVAKNMDKARELTGKFVDLFGKDRFFMEIQDHGIPDQYIANEGIIKLAQEQDLKLIATNDCHYMKREDADPHDILLCVQTGCVKSDQTRFRFESNEFYIKSPEEMAQIFRHYPDSITNTRLVADMCHVEMPPQEYHLPVFPCPDGMSADQFLEKNVWEGAYSRYGDRSKTDKVLRDRIEFELSVIQNMGFSAYFLIVADFIDHARSVGIPVGPGRGSAAGSVVAYCVKITQLCPLQHGLLFERFLNPDRMSMPDIDIDFSDDRRSEVIDYVQQKYGEKCVAQIVTFGTMKAKGAIRDVGRVLGTELKTVDKLAKLIPEGPKMNLTKALEESQELNQLVASDPELQAIWKYAIKIEGMTRHASTHAAGVVIADRDLTDYIPIYKTPKEKMPLTQFNMTQVEEMGLLKMDFLGIRNLSIIQRAENWLKERRGIEVDWDALEYKDKKTFDNLHKGQTAGVFQLESGGMTALVKALKPTEFADLTALLALYRPGPLKAGMHMMYVKRKHGEEKVVYDHPTLEPILKESYGIFLYQEQVMLVAMEMCGFTRGDADMLRKAMGKKNVEVMNKMKDQFITGARAKHDIDEDLSAHIWEQIVTFAGYGFNKSHSAAYAVITFQTAYLRANYPCYFQAALLTNEIGTVDSIAKYVSNAREVGLTVLPVDINKSREYFNPDEDKVWYAMGAVKSVGEGFVQAIIKERDENGEFESFQDFIMRVPVQHMNSRMLEALAKVGAFDSLHPNRRVLMEALPELLEAAHQKQAHEGEEDLFSLDGGGDEQFDQIPLPTGVKDWDDKSRANYEKEFLGFYLSEHPLNKYKVELSSFNRTASCQLDDLTEGMGEDDSKDISMMGCITSVMIRQSRNGNMFAIVTFEDMEGTFEGKFFAKTFDRFRDMLENDRVLFLRGRLKVWNNRPSFDVFDVQDAHELRERASGIEIVYPCHLLSEDAIRSLKEICQRYGGKRTLRLILNHESHHQIEFRPNGQMKVSLSDESLKELIKLPGAPVVRYFI